MAYQVRHRPPLLDADMQAALERRGKELLGLALLALGAALVALLGSYVPDDPSWLSATDAPAANLLGRFGASLASPLIVITGLGAWGIPLLALVWGVRFVLHRGEERVLGRAMFAPIAIALASVYASTFVPYAAWGHSFGLGGLFGDTILGALLNASPVGAALGLRIAAPMLALALLITSLFVLGSDAEEIRAFGRFLYVGVVLSYASMVSALGLAGRSGARAARRLGEQRRERRGGAAAAAQESRQRAHEDVVLGHSPVSAPAEHEKSRLLRRVRKLGRRVAAPEPEMVEPVISARSTDIEAPSADRIRDKIATIIKNRARGPQSSDAARNGADMSARSEPPLVGRRVAEAVKRHRAQANARPPMRLPPEPLVATPLFEPERDALQPAPEMQPAAPNAPTLKPMVHHKSRGPMRHSRQARAEAEPKLAFETASPQAYEPPPLSLLTNPDDVERHHLSDEALEENARMLESVLDDYGVKGEIISVRPGPVVTMYELEPAPGLKASRVIGLADDIARSMSALSARVSTVPGRSVIGIELPNAQREKVVLREILSSRNFGDTNMRLPLALGKNIGGDPVVASLAKMPHLLIAGTTGSGKSVAINTMILSLLYKLGPEECRLIMIDPKMLELSVYDGIPHLLSPVVTDPKKAVVALKWVVGEMEERYRKMSKMGVRNIDGYNGRVHDAVARGELFSRTVQTGFDEATGDPIFETEEFTPETVPYIVVIVDEMADLMMVAGKEIEACIQRLAQMARASGIHIIMATQRPSVDVITGTIKANFPTRISFQVTSKVDSRTILGEQGGEQLLGMGDMLYMAGGARITRVHGPFVSDEEVEEIVTYLKSFGSPDYVDSVLEGPDGDKADDINLVLGLGGNTDAEDALYDTAVAIVIKDRKCSTSYIQRKLAIGYNKAARLVEQMEDNGLVSSANHVGKREILVPEQ